MNRILILTAAGLLLAAPAGAQPPMGEGGDAFPLQKGTTWIYRVPGNKNKSTIKVVGEETVDVPEKGADGKVTVAKLKCSRLETSINGMVVASECVAIQADRVVRVKVGDREVKPALCFLKMLPAGKGESWPVQSEVGPEKISGTFQQTEVETTAFWEKVNKDEKPRKIKVAVVTAKNMIVNGQKMSLTSTYAPGVGLVKQEGGVGGAKITLELEKFEPPASMP